jgi:hypothetical protein
MIALSAGHYPGAKGAAVGDFNEHDEAVLWVREIYALMGVQRSAIVPTGTLSEKCTWINARKFTAAVEVHFNSLYADQTVAAEQGCMTLFMPGSSKGRELAERCHAAYVDLFLPDLHVREGYYRLDPKFGPDFFLARTNCPAVILEPEFIDRKEKIMVQRAEACQRLAAVLVEYLDTNRRD